MISTKEFKCVARCQNNRFCINLTIQNLNYFIRIVCFEHFGELKRERETEKEREREREGERGREGERERERVRDKERGKEGKR